MNKYLRFEPVLIPLVLSGEKNSTWRLFDDKDLSVGDTVDLLLHGSTQQFGTARLTKIIEKPFGLLTEKDKLGHEEFASDEQMYETYSKYYSKPVDKTTLVKIIWFELI